MNIVKFVWDNWQDEDWNGRHLIIGQHLKNIQNDNFTHCEVYGISLDIIDSKKDFQLKQHTCFSGNIVGDVQQISKAEARELLIKEIDLALAVMFDQGEMEQVNNLINIIPEFKEEQSELE